MWGQSFGESAPNKACRRRLTVLARPSLPLSAAPDAWRSALYTSHKSAVNQRLMANHCFGQGLEVGTKNQGLRSSPYFRIRDVYNTEPLALGPRKHKHLIGRLS